MDREAPRAEKCLCSLSAVFWAGTCFEACLSLLSFFLYFADSSYKHVWLPLLSHQAHPVSLSLLFPQECPHGVPGKVFIRACSAGISPVRKKYVYISATLDGSHLSKILPVEVRCYISRFGCLARNARCNTMSHLTADAGFSCTSRASYLSLAPAFGRRRRRCRKGG